MNMEEYREFDQDKEWAYVYSVAPKKASLSYNCTNIEGYISLDIAETMYKNEPGNFEHGEQQYKHALDGDGFVAAFEIKNGKCCYTGRFVETEYFLNEEDKIRFCTKMSLGHSVKMDF
eukprot:4820299-Ditylum_brightwellii.AAC.1